MVELIFGVSVMNVAEIAQGLRLALERTFWGISIPTKPASFVSGGKCKRPPRYSGRQLL